MADTGTPPEIPAELQQYNSYQEDPKWQIKFTIVWTALLAFFFLRALPRIIRENKRWRGGAFGVLEDWRRRYAYARLDHDHGPGEDDDESDIGHDGDKSEPKTTTGKNIGKAKNKSYFWHKNVPHQGAKHNAVTRFISALGAICYWTPPFIGLNIGQLILITSYFATVITCVVLHVPLATNPNRAGFLALAQLPPLFLLSSKSSPLALLLPSSFAYTRLNALHRWSARGVLLCGLIHGGSWIRNHVVWGLPIIGQQKESSGVAALGLLCVLGLTSVRVVRERAWAVFYWVHFLAFPSFFITICYHTPYASPWIFAPIAMYAFDLAMRAARVRVKDAYLIRVDSGMTVIRIPDCDEGFRAGQHLRVRVFLGGRGLFESHPLSIMCAPSSSLSWTCPQPSFALRSCIKARDVDDYLGGHHGRDKDKDKGQQQQEQGQGQHGHHGPNQSDITGNEAPGILLGARAVGDWTRALNEYAHAQEEEAIRVVSGSSSTPSIETPIRIPVQVMFDGPYGGCTLGDLGGYERVLLVAGGSGATFAVGLLDELVAGCCIGTGGKTRRVDFVWCTRSFGSIAWFAPLLRAIADTAVASGGGQIELRIKVYVTCLCVPEALPHIPGMEVSIGERPDMRTLVGGVVGLVDVDVEEGKEGEKKKENGVSTGRVAVCASGPTSLTRETANAVVRLVGKTGVEVGLHTEVFAI